MLSADEGRSGGSYILAEPHLTLTNFCLFNSVGLSWLVASRVRASCQSPVARGRIVNDRWLSLERIVSCARSRYLIVSANWPCLCPAAARPSFKGRARVGATAAACPARRARKSHFISRHSWPVLTIGRTILRPGPWPDSWRPQWAVSVRAGT